MTMRPGSLFCFSLFLLTGFSPLLFCQDDPAFRAWQKDEQSRYQQFRDKADREFYEFLKHEWRSVRVLKGELQDPVPDPVTAPVYTPPREQPPPAPPPAPPVSLEPPKPLPSPAQPPPTVPVAAGRRVGFYGVELGIPLPEALRVALKGEPGKESISAYFAAMAETPYDATLAAAKQIRAARRLNDWGFCLLLASIGERLHGPNTNEKVLFTWFMLLKSGFETKVGYAGPRVVLLLRTGERLFAVPFLSLDGGPRYYAVSLDAGSPVDLTELYAYNGEFPGAANPVRFAVAELPVLSNTTATKTLRFTYRRTEYSVPVTYSRDAVRFFENYPQTEFEVYFNGSVSSGAANSLYRAFAPILKGKSEVEAVNILLRFAQTAFGYKLDKDQFGREKPMFPDEVLHYDNSNCKDRAILFAYLVSSLTRLEVIGLDYPGHIATAVRFSGDVPGDAVRYQGQRYVICDPTYINAEAGSCMPNLRDLAPGIIKLHRVSPS